MSVKMFISYSTKDINFVDKIKLLLYKKFPKKIKYVISAEQKKIGAIIPGKIIGHIEDCEWFLILFTRNSVSNPTVISEFGYANALYNLGKLKKIIPIVERYKDEEGKTNFINTGVFVDKNIESAKFFSDKDKWEDCIRDLESYLHIAYEEHKKPEYIKLEIEGKRLSDSGYYWEAAEHFRKAAKQLKKSGEKQKSIINFVETAKLYQKGEYLWEESQQYLEIAKIYEDEGEKFKAAESYEKRGHILTSRLVDYSWETAKSYEKAGQLYLRIKKLDKSKIAFRRAVEIYKEDDNDTEIERVEGILKKL